MNKLTIKRMKMSICDESGTSSSSEDDVLPILPETSSGELSTIEESHLEHDTGSESSGSSSSKYMSSFINDSMTSISSCASDDRKEFQSRDISSNVEMNQTQHESELLKQEVSSDNSSFGYAQGNTSSQRCLITPEPNQEENSVPEDVVVGFFSLIREIPNYKFIICRSMSLQIIL